MKKTMILLFLNYQIPFDNSILVEYLKKMIDIKADYFYNFKRRTIFKKKLTFKVIIIISNWLNFVSWLCIIKRLQV